MKNDHDEDNNDETTPKSLDKGQQPPKNATPKSTKPDKRTLVPRGDDDGDEYDPDKSFRQSSDYPPSWTLYEKMSKETACFQKGAPFHNCGKCTYYQAGHCKIVRGYIAAEMGCKYFQEKYTPMTITIRSR